MPIYYYHTPLGRLLLKTDSNDSFTHIFFEDPAQSNKISPEQLLPLAQDFATDLTRYFKGESLSFNWPLQVQGTEFQKQVWQQLLNIPYGKTTTYKNIATNLATKGYQAVGSAIGANPLAIIIPCHRVLGANHSLRGYRYGIHRKQFLLEIERALPVRDFC